MNGYTKLFQSILASSIWSEDDQTRIVWITMLAMADKHGEVHASVPGLARMAGVPIAATETAIQRFLSPDPYSRTPDNEGRRLLPMVGGWRIANHAKYRLMASREDEKAKTAARVAAHRAKRAEPVGSGGDAVKIGEPVTHRYTPLQGVTDTLQRGVGNGGVTVGMHIAEAEADTGIPPIAPQGGETQTPLQLENEPPPPPKPDPLAGFALFWQAYPKKTNQPTAKRAWLKLKPDADLARRIVEDVQARRNSFDWTKDSGQFIPNPGTYLNGRRWEDAVETLAPVAKPEPKTAAEHETKLGRPLTWAEKQALEAGLPIA